MFKRITQLGLGLMILASTSTPSAFADTRLLVNCFWPSQHFMCQEVVATWKANVEKVTERRVLVDVPAQSMSPPPEQLASVRSGIFDAAIQANIFLANEVKGPTVPMVPFAASANAEANSVAMWRTYAKFFSSIDEYDDVHLLSVFATPGIDLYSLTDKPILSLSGLKERKMWGLPGTIAETLKSAGVPVVSGPAVQMTEIIQRGVVDGFVGVGAADSRAFNLLPYIKSVTQTDRKINAGAFSFFISDSKWAEISAADQAKIMEVSGEAFARMAGGIWQKYEIDAMADMVKKIKVVKADAAFEAELATATQSAIDLWIKEADEAGFDGQASLDYFKAQVVELNQ